MSRKYRQIFFYPEMDLAETYDYTGAVDYLDVFSASEDAYANLTISAGARVAKRLVDGTARTGYMLDGVWASHNFCVVPSNSYRSRINRAHLTRWRPSIISLTGNDSFPPPIITSCTYNVYTSKGVCPNTRGEQLDRQFLGQRMPTFAYFVLSLLYIDLQNFTYNTDMGGFSDDNLMSIDQRGFKHLIQAEAADFIQPHQMMLNSTVKTIAYSNDGVTVTLTNGTKLTAEYALCTFSLGVLQHDDVKFEPELPYWKEVRKCNIEQDAVVILC